MTQNLCSWFKSSAIKLQRHIATHPAGVARRFPIGGFDDPDCNLGESSFSKSLAKVLSNHVAFVYTMSFKKGKEDVTALAKLLPEFCEATLRFSKSQEKLETMSRVDDEEYHTVLKDAVQMTKDMVFRGKLICSALTVASKSHGSSTYVSKVGPSINMSSPSAKLMQQHVGMGPGSAAPIVAEPRRVQLTKKRSTASSVTLQTTDTPTTAADSKISAADTPPPKAGADNVSKKPITPLKLSNVSPELQVVLHLVSLSPILVLR